MLSKPPQLKSNAGYSFHFVFGTFSYTTNNITSIWKPDWKDIAQYPDPKKAYPIQWAWEFLRRNPEYQQDYLMVDEYYIKNELGGKSVDYPLKVIHRNRLLNIFKKYNISGIVDPKAPHGANVLTILGFLDAKYPLCYFYKDTQAFKDIEPTEPQEVSMTFDVSLPINPQLKRAKSTLNHQRDSLIKKGIIKNIDNKILREENYRDYLRIYDARLKKVSFNEIAEVIYPNLYDVDPKKKVEAAFKAAKKWLLRDINQSLEKSLKKNSTTNKHPSLFWV